MCGGCWCHERERAHAEEAARAAPEPAARGGALAAPHARVIDRVRLDAPHVHDVRELLQRLRGLAVGHVRQHDRDAAEVGDVGRRDGQRVDVEAARRQEAADLGEHARLVVNEHGQRVAPLARRERLVVHHARHEARRHVDRPQRPHLGARGRRAVGRLVRVLRRVGGRGEGSPPRRRRGGQGGVRGGVRGGVCGGDGGHARIRRLSCVEIAGRS